MRCKANQETSVFSLLHLLALLGNATLTFAFPTPSFTGLGDLPYGPYYSIPTSISSDGHTVVGASGSQASYGQEPFRWDLSNGMVGLGTFPGTFNIGGSANAISADGSTVVGYVSIGPQIISQAFRWTAESGMENLGDLPGGLPGSNAFGVSADGMVVVGQATASDGASEPVRWAQNDGMISLGRLSPFLGGGAVATSYDGSVVVGYSGSQGFRWSDSEGLISLGDLPGGGVESTAWDITTDGSTVVGYATTPAGHQAASWTTATGWVALRELDAGSGFESVANSISDDGTRIVGRSYNGSDSIATIWDQQSARAIQEILEGDLGLDIDGWALTSAVGISNDGLTIVGIGRNPQWKTEAWIAVVPEPSGLLLLSSCVVFVVSLGRKLT